MSAALRCVGLQAGYQGRPVVRNVDLDLQPGTVTVVLGPNGAGKTTLMLTMSGLLPAVGGTIEIDGADLTKASTAARVRKGLILVPDDRSLFATLTVREHLVLAGKRSDAIDPALGYFPALKHRLDVRAGMLSGGEQQMLAIGRALMQSPKVLLIDELSMGLAPIIVNRLLGITRSIADDTGAAVVLIEQHAFLALEHADRAVVLVHGDVAIDDDASALLHAPERIEAAYLALGEDHPGRKSA